MNDIAKRIAALPPEKRRQLLERLTKKDGEGSAQKISRQSRETNTFPLSFAQQRLWFLDQLEPNSFTWNISLSYEVTGQINEQALERALQDIVKRHEVLRSTFAVVDGRPVQIIAKQGILPFSIIDMGNLPASECDLAFQRLLTEEVERPFDLAKGPLLRVKLLNVGKMQQIFILTMHHIVSDAWSIGVFFKELRAFYTAHCNGRPHALPELPIQYADFASWQREWLEKEVLATQLSYWKEQLGGRLPVLQLPADRPRPNVQTFSGAIEPFKLSRSLLTALKKLSRQEGVTLFMTLLAAFKALIYRYSGQEDVIVGSPIAGRNRAEFEGLIGCFLNTMVMRSDMSGNPTFRQMLSQVQRVAMGAYAHQDLPFEKLVEELQPDRDLSTSPLFQVMFVLQNAPAPNFEIFDFTLTPITSELKPSRFDLTLYMGELDEQLRGAAEYNTDLFDRTTMKRMCRHFQMLLESIVADPNQRIADLPILTNEEKHQVVVEWNTTRLEYPKERCFQKLFEAQVEKTPEATALVFENQKLTYQQLNARANQLAHHLKKMGVGPDVLVGIYVERSVEMLVGLLGILKAGGAYVPLDPAYPRERIAYMLQDSGASVLLTQEKLVNHMPRHCAQVLCLDSDWKKISQEANNNPGGEPMPENVAYVIYTSGSTGKPKGVAVQHYTLVNFLNSMANEPGLISKDVLLAVTTLSFDIAGLELYLPLMIGAQVNLVSREVASDGRRLSKALADSGATVMQASPATWQLLLESGWQGSPQLKILCGGEALPRELANRLLPCCESLWNMYGPTESTIWSAVQKVEGGDGPISIGRPIANTQIYILDRNFNPVPVGVYGELYIGGDGLARGYLNRSELTAEKFVPHPLSQEDGARIYSSGDQARFLSDGRIELVGRLDHQVKVRGFRIELGEIEATLAQHKAVDQVVVVVRGGADSSDDKHLAAYMVAAPEQEPTVGDLRGFLMESLPEYMVPTAFVFLDAFPLTPNGKVDRKTLPSPEGVHPKLGSEYVAPQSEIERTITSIWQEVLKMEKVGIDDNFFDLGGHSMLLVRIQGKLSEAFNRDISIIELFKYPTVNTLAQYVAHDDSSEETDYGKYQDIAKKQKQAMERQKKLSREVPKDDASLEHV